MTEMEELVARVSKLPAFRQQEVFDFVIFLEQRCGSVATEDATEWTDQQYVSMSAEQAMRGLSEERELYSEEDLKERWR